MANITQQSHSTVTVLDLTNYWCKTLGIQSKDLGCGVRHTDKGIQIDNQTSHPQIDDVILLIKFIKEFNSFFNNDDRIAVHVIWTWCYSQKLPLKKRHFKRLLNIGTRARRKRFFKQAQLDTARQKIRTLTR
jgi:hypothetical protein